MPGETRVAFTPEDRQLLAEYLFKLPEHKRSAPSNFQEIAKRHPHHTYQSWLDHFRKTGREDVNRRIERLKRQQKREEEDAKNRTAEGRRASGSDDTASRNAKGKGKAAERADEDAEQEEEEDELDLDDGDVVVEAGPPKGSSSKPRAPDAGPSSGPAQLPAAKKKKRHRSPTPSSSDSSSSDDAPSRKKPKKRIRFDDDDFDTLVLMLDKSDRKGWTRQDLYKKLEQMCPAHTASSWQTYHSQNREDVDDALKRLRKRLKREAEGKKTKKPKSATIDVGDDERVNTDEDEQERRRRKKGKAREVERRLSDDQGRLSQASFISSKRPVSKAAADEPSSASSSDAAAKSAAAKIKSGSKPKARSSTTASPQKITSNGQPEPPFTEEDDARLVQHLASGMMNGRDHTFVWKELARVQPAHPASSWQARFSSDMSGFLLRVTDKIRIAEKARQRKAELEEEKRAAEAEEAWRREEEEAERRKQREEEARQAKLRAEQERLRRAQEDEDRLRRHNEEAAAAAATGQIREDADRATPTGDKTISAPVPSAPTAKTAVAEPVKLATPRPSPPRSSAQLGRAIEPEADDVQAVATQQQEAVKTAGLAQRDAPSATANQPPADLADDVDHAEADEEQPEPVSSSLGLPRLSQYSVMPSPFLQDNEAREGGYVEEDEDDRELDRDLAAQIKAEEEELAVGVDSPTYAEAELSARIQEALGEPGSSDYSDDDDAPIWDQLDAAEAGFVEDVHAQVAMLQQGHIAPRPAKGKELAASVAHRGVADLVEDVKFEETVVIQETVETVEEVVNGPEVDQASPPPQRQPFALPPSPQLPRAQNPVKRTLSDVSTPGSPADHDMRGPEKKRPRLDSAHPAASAIGQSAATLPTSAPEATPTPRRRIPRASLAASTPSVASSPAPRAMSTSSQAVEAKAEPPKSSAVPGAASVPAAASDAASSARNRPPLKEVLESIAAEYRLSFNRVRNLFYCYSALNDFATFRDVVSFFSEPFKPDEGSVEHARAKRAVERYLWSLREDEIVLEGTEAAQQRIEDKKGKGAVVRRRQFLHKARVNRVSELTRDRYPA